MSSSMHITTDWVGRWARYSPDRIMLEDEGGRCWTYAQSDQMVNRLGNLLLERYGICRGDRIAILSQNEPEYVFLFFAVQKIGAILVPLNFRLTPRELGYVLSDADPQLFLYQQEYVAVVEQIDATGTTSRQCWDGPEGFLSQMADLPQRCVRSTHPAAEGSFDDTCMILYTSGTTGRAKGAMITNAMLYWNSVNTGLRLNLTQDDVTLVFAPFFHTGGWNVLTTPFIHRGARLVMMRRFDPEQVLQRCAAHGVTILFGVPTMLDMMYRSPEFAKADLRSLRYMIVGGEPMPIPLIEVWQDKGIPIRQGYGLTEFGPNVFSLNQEDAIRKKGSIGFPNFYIDARVVNEAGDDVGDNAHGELILRGPVCMKGYWNNAEATAATIRQGWLHTGDIVRRDAQGYFYVVDRKKDMYISGAENVYPAEIEHFLRTHPAVREVAVIGVPDAKWGEAGMAFIVLHDGVATTSEQIITYCGGQLARFKIPRHVRFIEALPKSDSGKILKRRLHELV